MNRPNVSKADRDDLVNEQLVAYLDGEIDADTQRQVERRLADDAEFRDRLRSLERAWHLLDQLPIAQTDPSFTQSTVEMVAVRQENELAPRRRAGRRWGLSGALVVAGLTGYLIAATLAARSQQQLLRDLPVIENVDRYRYAESVQFLGQLQQQGLFSPSQAPNIDIEPAEVIFISSDPVQVEHTTEDLTSEQKISLQSRRERFHRLPRERQQQLRDLHASIDQQPDAEDLLTVMGDYCEWLKTLRPDSKAQLLDLPIDERLLRIASIQEDQQRRQLRARIRESLSEQDVREIFAWSKRFIFRHEDEMLKQLDPGARRYVQSIADPDQRRQRLLSFGRRMGVRRFPDPEPAEIHSLALRLSTEARAELTSRKEMDEKVRLVHQWVRHAVFSKMWLSNMNVSDVERILERLPEADRKRLRDLPPDEFRRELRKHVRPPFMRGKGGPPRRPGARGRSGRSPIGDPHRESSRRP